ncbi:MAG: hypothetical protein AAFR21_02570 [Pseudomonadota bacterium]
MLSHVNSMRCWVIAAFVLLVGLFTPAYAVTIVIEPVFRTVPGTGGDPENNVIGFTLPPGAFVNPGADGIGPPDPERFWEGDFIGANMPGESFYYPAGFPADPFLQSVLRFYNNTDETTGGPGFTISGFVLSIIGQAFEPLPFQFDFLFPDGPCGPDGEGGEVCFDPDLSFIFGDVDGDGIGFGPQADGFSMGDPIFGSVSVSEDGQTITYSDGEIPLGGRFTDIFLVKVLDDDGMEIPFMELPEDFFALAAIDSSFTGREVPIPAAWVLMLAGLIGMRIVGRK